MHDVAIVGGDGRIDFELENVNVETFASQQDGGNGEITRITASIKHGSYDLVVLLIRWLGHSASKQVVKACKSAGVRFIAIRGGRSAARRETVDALDGLHEDG